ncbi:unnamed protein product [Moneuplotes crassus]|uniref:Uncharacterized protein n=1 Tax=Euplotes crassus TaxID=5936 RepID=A0AAD1U992_EUPCR|nr:unnamed protein product [Moneuplotes crassus]
MKKRKNNISVVLGSRNFKEQNEVIGQKILDSRIYELCEPKEAKERTKIRSKTQSKTQQNSSPTKVRRSNFYNVVNLRTKPKQPDIRNDLVIKLKEKIDPDKIRKHLNRKNTIVKMFDRYLSEIKGTKIYHRLTARKDLFQPKKPETDDKDHFWLKIMSKDDDPDSPKYVSKCSKVSFFEKYKNLMADNSSNVLPETFFRNEKFSSRSQTRRTVYTSVGVSRNYLEKDPNAPRDMIMTSCDQKRVSLQESMSPIYPALKERKGSTKTPIFNYKRVSRINTKTTRDHSKSQTSQNKPSVKNAPTARSFYANRSKTSRNGNKSASLRRAQRSSVQRGTGHYSSTHRGTEKDSSLDKEQRSSIQANPYKLDINNWLPRRQ